MSRKRRRVPEGFPTAPKPPARAAGRRAASHDSICTRCHGDIDAAKGDPVVLWHGEWVHAECVPGGDDE